MATKEASSIGAGGGGVYTDYMSTSEVGHALRVDDRDVGWLVKGHMAHSTAHISYSIGMYRGKGIQELARCQARLAPLSRAQAKAAMSNHDAY